MAEHFLSKEEMPFFTSSQLGEGLDKSSDGEPCLLPGHIGIFLDDQDQLTEFLLEDFLYKDLDDMAPRLWVMST